MTVAGHHFATIKVPLLQAPRGGGERLDEFGHRLFIQLVRHLAVEDPEPQLEALRGRHPIFPSELSLFLRCARLLPEVLRGNDFYRRKLAAPRFTLDAPASKGAPLPDRARPIRDRLVEAERPPP